MGNRFILVVITFLFITVLTACGADNASDGNIDNNNTTEQLGADVVTDGEDETNPLVSDETTSDGTPSEIPEGIKEAVNPKFKVGDQVIINAEHEEGMKGAEGTVVGAYDTIVYSVSYTPTHGDHREENHKWIVHEELQGIDEQMLVPGSEVIIESDQEEGMLGAEGEIDTAEKTTAYMVEYEATDGKLFKKWFKESELTAK
ncbi:hypothetical protein UACE39S_03845 [Ureibacillus acetophenoni]